LIWNEKDDSQLSQTRVPLNADCPSPDGSENPFFAKKDCSEQPEQLQIKIIIENPNSQIR